MPSRLDYDPSTAPGSSLSEVTRRAYAYPSVGETVTSREDMTAYHKLHIYAYDKPTGMSTSGGDNRYQCAGCQGECVLRFEVGPCQPGKVIRCTPCTCARRNPMIVEWGPGRHEWTKFKTYEKPRATRNLKKKPKLDYHTAVCGTILCWINESYNVRIVKVVKGSPILSTDKLGRKNQDKPRRFNQDSDRLTTFLTSCGKVYRCHYSRRKGSENEWRWKYCHEISEQIQAELAASEAAEHVQESTANSETGTLGTPHQSRSGVTYTTAATITPNVETVQQANPKQLCPFCQDEEVNAPKLRIVNCPNCLHAETPEERLVCGGCLERICNSRVVLPLDSPTTSNFEHFQLELDYTSFGYTCPFDKTKVFEPKSMLFSEFPKGNWHSCALPSWYLGNFPIHNVVYKNIMWELYNYLIEPFVSEYLNAEELKRSKEESRELVLKVFGNGAKEIEAADKEIDVLNLALKYFKEKSLDAPWLSATSLGMEPPSDVIAKATNIKSGALPKICARTEFANEKPEHGRVYMDIVDRANLPSS